MKSFKQFMEDVRKMPGGGYGVYADKFVKGKRVTLPSGKHQKELKKVYKNKKDANDYMAAIMIAKGGGYCKILMSSMKVCGQTSTRNDRE